MTRTTALLAGILLLVLSFGVTAAQNEPGAGCTADSLTALVASIQEANGKALESIQAGDLAAAIDLLAASDERVGLMKAVCAGLTFEDTAAKALGPVELPEGTYRATATTDGFMTVEFTVLDGECGETLGDLVMPVFTLFQDQATTGAETIVPSDGCSVLIEVSNVTAPWTLTFERLG
jgi:hypothetical protein